MEMDLKGIIEKIKTEGVDEAEVKASAIIEDAEQKAKEIVLGAEKTQKETIEKTEEESKKMVAKAEAAISQAARDAVLSLKGRITGVFDSIFKQNIAEILDSGLLKDMVIKLVDGFIEKGETNLEILVNEKDKDKLEKAVLAELKGKAKEGISFKVSPGIENGFLIKEAEGGAYYDFTDEAITEAFKAFLNPKVTKMLKLDQANG